MPKINVTDVTKLMVYQRSFDVSIEIYKLTKDLKLYSLKDQVIRSSTSTFANISEGMMFRNLYPNKTATFLATSLGSCNETKTWLMYFKSIGVIDSVAADKLIDECGEISLMLCSMINKIYTEIHNSLFSTSTKSTKPTSDESYLPF